jgi:polysaccharide pyruvyl transferase WcaK-like protein
MHLKNIEQFNIPKEDIILIGHQPKYMSWYFNHPIKNCVTNASQIAFNDVSALLVTGGGTINTRDKNGLSLKRMHGLIQPFANNNIPIFISGQTIGELGIYPEHDALAKEIIEWADVITARDLIYSHKYVDMVGATPKRLVNTCDDAVDLPYCSEDISNIALYDFMHESKKLCVINITDYTVNSPKKIDVINNTITEVLERGYRVVLLPHTPKDYQFFIKNIPLVEDIFLVDIKGLRGVDLKNIISNCDIAIGGRYHFLVFCLTAGVPCVGMAGNKYSYIKQHGFADQLNCGKFILQETQCLTPYIMALFDEIKDKEITENISPLSFKEFDLWFKGLTL